MACKRADSSTLASKTHTTASAARLTNPGIRHLLTIYNFVTCLTLMFYWNAAISIWIHQREDMSLKTSKHARSPGAGKVERSLDREDATFNAVDEIRRIGKEVEDIIRVDGFKCRTSGAEIMALAGPVMRLPLAHNLAQQLTSALSPNPRRLVRSLRKLHPSAINIDSL